MRSLISGISAALIAVRRRMGSHTATPRGRSLGRVVPARNTTSHAPTLLLVNDCRDQANYGAEALVEGLARILDAAIPGHALRLIPSHWLLDSQFARAAFHDGAALTQPHAIWPEVADQFDSVAEEWLAGRGGRDVNAFLEKLDGVDVVVLNGEGSMYRNNLSAVRELFLAWLARAKLDIPTVCINSLVHLTQVVPILPAMMRKAFAVLDGVAVRDPYSLRNVQAFMPEIPVKLVPDSALAVPVEIDNPSPRVKALFEELGNTPFFCFDPGPMPIDHRFGKRSALYRLITDIKQLVPQAVMVASAPAETSMLKQLAADTSSIYLEHQPSYKDLMAVLARTKFQISGRNHNPILGALVGCPAISIASSSHKVHGICELLGFSEPYDGTDLWPNIQRMKAHAARHLAGGATLRSEIATNAARLAAQSFEMGVIVRDALSKRSGLVARPQ